jgi:hypothetical protein
MMGICHAVQLEALQAAMQAAKEFAEDNLQ